MKKSIVIIVMFCQRVGNPSRRDEIPLIPQVNLQVFDKWEVEFVGPINPPSRISGERYIITMIKYFTRWDEQQEVKGLQHRDYNTLFI
jgi:hypothetical protein